ncbi:hypothetical protein A9R05_22930 [Burkholderia sp. KK1]|nr:hypothetical protein A9R05_22930 [Burkholderia sp. KK1]
MKSASIRGFVWMDAFVPQALDARKQQPSQPVGRLLVHLLVDGEVKRLRRRFGPAAKSPQAVENHSADFEWLDLDFLAVDRWHCDRAEALSLRNLVWRFGGELYARGQS